MLQPSPEALLEAIARTGNEAAQGWMQLLGTASLALAGAPWLSAPEPLHASFQEKQKKLWQSLLDGRREEVAPPSPRERRFAHPAWRENRYYDYLRQSYLLAADYLTASLERTALEPRAKARARFALRQWLDAMCPANFAATNPEVTALAGETGGESLAKGLANLIADLRAGRIRHTDESAFEVGRNLAVTPGAVVYENELIQLIQYSPSTAEVAQRPLVIVPPCINKYYLLDLQPDNSFVAHAVASGNTVFVISWRNVGPEQGHLGWDDYIEKGVLTALRVAREIADADKVNALGFCVGGTLLGAALAVLAARHEALVASAAFLAAMLDFSDAGEIGLFVDEASVAAREAAIGAGGIFPGAELAFVFCSLRANDLIWPYVVGGYLLGKSPPAFDLLHWNADSTNLPGPMYCYYLRNLYLENRLREPGALVNCGVPVDLAKIALPVFVLATREDHIVPWRSAYRTLGLLGGEDKTFVLGASGHVAGVVSPPRKRRRSYWTATRCPQDPDSFLAEATQRRGSWWPLWSRWLARQGGARRAAPSVLGNVRYAPLEAAPGRYVKQRIS